MTEANTRIEVRGGWEEVDHEGLSNMPQPAIRDAAGTGQDLGDDSALGARRTLNQGRAAPTGRMTSTNLPPEGTT
jgi:hypothetical protein